MMIKKLLLFMFGFAVASTSMAQQRGTCGTVSDADRAAITKRLLKNKEAVKNGLVTERTAITWVPIKFHLIADDNGNGRVREISVYDQLCKLNTAYLDQEIQFYVHDGFSYLNSSVAYNSPTSSGGQFQLQARKKNGMMNVFIPKNADTGGIGTTLGFYSPFGDWIVMRQDEVSGFNTTLIHEGGHFFSLLHPHNGWDNINYDAAVHGNPAPNLSPGGTATERQDRTGSCKNCETAGDFLCDTAPDYNFGFGSTTCNYLGNVKDPCDVDVDPDEALYMSYFGDECQNYFSDEQKAMISADLTQRRNFGTINKNFIPSNTEPLGGQTTLAYPPAGENIGIYNYVTFDWTDVANADGYFFELDRSPNFNFQPVYEIITDGSSSFQAMDLKKNIQYYWRVTPYNQSSSCVGTTDIQTFNTGDMESTAVPTITSVNSWSVQPNPVQKGDNMTIQLETSQAFDADIMLYDITGKLVKRIPNKYFASGASTVQIATDDLNNGMYVLAIKSEKGILNNKIVVAR